MPRLIDADTVATFQTYDDKYEEWSEETLTIADALDKWSDEGCPPTIEAEPVRHGTWVVNDLGRTHCSKCGERLPFFHCYSDECCSDYDEEWDEEIPQTRFCPNCGAKMDGGANNNDR